MDKIQYTNKDINFLLSWRDKNQELVRMGFCPIKAIKIMSIESGITLTCIRKNKTVNISITRLGKSLGALSFECLPLGLCRITRCTAKNLKQDDIQSVITVYASTMAIMAFGGYYQFPDERKETSKKTYPVNQKIKLPQRSTKAVASHMFSKGQKEMLKLSVKAVMHDRKEHFLYEDISVIIKMGA